VAFDKTYKRRNCSINEHWQKEEEAKKQAPIILEAQETPKMGGWR
jgi:hypothetical protein